MHATHATFPRVTAQSGEKGGVTGARQADEQDGSQTVNGISEKNHSLKKKTVFQRTRVKNYKKNVIPDLL